MQRSFSPKPKLRRLCGPWWSPRVFAKITETERSFFGSNAIKRKFSNERTNADGGEPNTAVAATKSGVSATRISFRRSPERDAAAILLAYRHGPRAAELTALCWAQVDLHTGRLHVNRAKGGQEALHLLCGPELRALRRLLPARSYVFETEQGSPVTTAWFLRMFSAPAKPRSLRSPCTRTCCGMLADTSSPTMATTADRSRATWGIATCRARRATPRWRRIGLRGFGRTSVARR
jgi:integrase